MQDVKKRIGVPHSTLHNWRKELALSQRYSTCSDRARIVYELGYLQALETLMARDISKKFMLTADEWKAIFAACNGNSMFWPQTMENNFTEGSMAVRAHVPTRPLSWQFREWCRHNYDEAVQFGDPHTMYYDVGKKIDVLNDAEQFYIMRVMAMFWDDKNFDLKKIVLYLIEMGLIIQPPSFANEENPDDCNE